MAAYGLWLVVKLRPHGFHNLLPTIAALVAAFVFAGARNDASVEQWEIVAPAVTLMAWTIAGLLDLGLLMKSLSATRIREAEAGEQG